MPLRAPGTGTIQGHEGTSRSVPRTVKIPFLSYELVRLIFVLVVTWTVMANICFYRHFGEIVPVRADMAPRYSTESKSLANASINTSHVNTHFNQRACLYRRLVWPADLSER